MNNLPQIAPKKLRSCPA